MLTYHGSKITVRFLLLHNTLDDYHESMKRTKFGWVWRKSKLWCTTSGNVWSYSWYSEQNWPFSKSLKHNFHFIHQFYFVLCMQNNWNYDLDIEFVLPYSFMWDITHNSETQLKSLRADKWIMITVCKYNEYLSVLKYKRKKPCLLQ